MSIKQKAIRGGIWSAIQQGGSQAGSLIVFLVLARLLEPSDFGLMALANVFLAFMQILLKQGFAQAIVQREALEPEHLDTAFWTNLAIGLSLTTMGVFSASFVAAFFQQPQLTPLLQALSVLFTIASLSNVQQAILERKFAYKAIAARSLLATCISGIVGTVMAFWGFGVWSLVVQQLVNETVATLVLWKASDWRPSWRFSVVHFQHLFHFGISILGFNVLTFLNTRSDDFLIGYFLGPVALGYYSVAYRILTLMTQLLVNTSKQVALPTFSRLQQDLARFRRTFYTTTQLTSVIAFPVFLGIVTLASELVEVVFGERWLPSVPVMQVLALVGMVRAISYFKSSVFTAMGKPAWNLWIGLLGTILNLLGFSIAVHWGIVAVAGAYLIRHAIMFPIGQWAVTRLIHIPLGTYLQQFIAPLVSSIMMALAILAMKSLLGDAIPPLIWLLIGTVTGVAIYSLSIRLLAPNLWQKLLEIAHSLLLSFKSQKI